MSHRNAGADNSVSSTSTARALVDMPTVLVTIADADSLNDWATQSGTVLDVIPVEDWTKPPLPKDLPNTPIHMLVETRGSKTTYEAVKSLCTALAQTGREPLLVETTLPLSAMLNTDTTWDSFTAHTVAKPAGRAPAAERVRAARRDAAEVRCLTSEGLTVQGEGDHQVVLLSWGAWEIETSQIGPRSSLSLGVVFQTEGGPVTHIRMDDIEGATLDDFKWMEAHPVVRKLPRPDHRARVAIANAIRAADGPNGEQSLARTGRDQMAWIEVNGLATYVKTDAGLNSGGLDRTVYGGNIAASGDTYYWGEEVSLDREKAALRAVLITMPAMMRAPAAWYALLAQFGRASSPCAAMTPFFLHGLTNSGKTVLARSASGLSSVGLLEGELANFNATKVAVEMIAAQFATGICLIDDIPPTDDAGDLKRIRDSIDELMRVAHPEGSLKDRGGLVQGGVGLAARAEVHPCALVTTEENLVKLMPRQSTRNRGLAIHIVRGQEFDSGDASDNFEETAKRFAPTAGYAVTRWMADQIDRAGGITAYNEKIKKTVQALRNEVEAAHTATWDTDPRVYKVCAALLHGLSQIANAAIGRGAISESEGKQFMLAGSESIVHLFDMFVENWLSQVEGVETISDIWVQIRAGRACLGEACVHGTASGLSCGKGCGVVRTIGKYVSFQPGHKDAEDGGDYVALSPNDLADVLSRPGALRTKEQVEKQLRDIKGSVGGYRTRLGGNRAYCVIVPKHIFKDDSRGLTDHLDEEEA